MMLRVPGITTSFTADHYYDKTSKRATPEHMRAKFKKADVILIFWTSNHRWWLRSMIPWSNTLIIHSHMRSPGPCQYQLPGPAVPSEVVIWLTQQTPCFYAWAGLQLTFWFLLLKYENGKGFEERQTSYFSNMLRCLCIQATGSSLFSNSRVILPMESFSGIWGSISKAVPSICAHPSPTVTLASSRSTDSYTGYLSRLYFKFHCISAFFKISSWVWFLA